MWNSDTDNLCEKLTSIGGLNPMQPLVRLGPALFRGSNKVQIGLEFCNENIFYLTCKIVHIHI